MSKDFRWNIDPFYRSFSYTFTLQPGTNNYITVFDGSKVDSAIESKLNTMAQYTDAMEIINRIKKK